MSIASRLFQYDNGTLADGNNLETELDQIYSTLNNLDNTNLSATAGIKGSQCATGANGMATANIQDDAIDFTKLADHATVDASRAVGKNHIRDDAVCQDSMNVLTYSHASIISIAGTVILTKVSTGISSVDYAPLCVYFDTNTADNPSTVIPLIESSLIKFLIINNMRHDGLGGSGTITIPANALKLDYIKRTRA